MGRKPKEPTKYALVLAKQSDVLDYRMCDSLEDVDTVMKEVGVGLENVLVFPCFPLVLEKKLGVAHGVKAPSKPRTPKPAAAKPVNGKTETAKQLDKVAP